MPSDGGGAAPSAMIFPSAKIVTLFAHDSFPLPTSVVAIPPEPEQFVCLAFATEPVLEEIVLRQQLIEGHADQLLAGPTEVVLGTPIRELDMAVAVDDDHGRRSRFHHDTELLVGKLALGDIHEHATQADGFSCRTHLALTPCQQPTAAIVGVHRAVFEDKRATGRQGRVQRVVHALAVRRMDSLEVSGPVEWLAAWHAEQLARAGGQPQFPAAEIPFPCAETGCKHGILDALLALAKRTFDDSEVPRKLPCPDDIAAEFVTHDQEYGGERWKYGNGQMQ